MTGGDAPDPRAVPPQPVMLALFGLIVFYGAQVFAAVLMEVKALVEPADIERGNLAAAMALVGFVAFALSMRPLTRLWRRGAVLPSLLAYSAFLVGWLPLALIVYPILLRGLGDPLVIQPALGYLTEGLETRPPMAVLNAILVSCVLAPIGEELLFRGYLQDALERVMPTGLAVAFTAALFGLAHGAQYALPVALLGGIFGIVKVRHGCMIAPIVVHATHNTLTVATAILFPDLMTWIYRA